MNQDENKEMSKENNKFLPMENCPHCGRQLSPWEQILLNVDRMLMCKSCWYRIVLDVFSDKKETDENKNKDIKE